MLELSIIDGASPLTTVEIANIGGANAEADYAVCVYDAGDDLIASAVLSGYARWSAPAHDLVLRAICVAFADEERIVAESLPHIFVPDVLVATLCLTPPASSRRLLGRWTVHCTNDFVCGVEDESGEPAVYHRNLGAIADAGVWPLLLTTWSIELYGTARVAPRLPRVSVPVHFHKCYPYVRVSELPKHMRSPLEQRLYGSTQPCVPGIDDAIYVWDLESFLGYAP